jgi:selenocysteine lyase/cysteine desulfurase
MADAALHAQFPNLNGVAYFDTAAEGLLPLAAQNAACGYLQGKTHGSTARPEFYATEHRAAAAAARLLDAPPDSVAIIGSASDGLNLLAHSIHWRDGDEVLITDLEFPSNVYPWLRLRDRGVRLVVIPTTGGIVRLTDFTSRFTPRTRLVSVSFVSYLSGTRIPFLNELGAAARRAGALFAVDATQGLGRVPLCLDNIDFLVASSYKWLLGIHGAGIAYLNPRLFDSFTPDIVGWYSMSTIFTPYRFERYDLKPGARRLLCGMPNFAAHAALEQGINLLLERRIDRLYHDLLPLVRQLRQALAQAGFQLLTPDDEAYGSGIVSFRVADPSAARQALAGANVVVWAGDGRVRASVHLYNDEGDIRRLLDVVPRLKA